MILIPSKSSAIYREEGNFIFSKFLKSVVNVTYICMHTHIHANSHIHVYSIYAYIYRSPNILQQLPEIAARKLKARMENSHSKCK